MSVESEEAREAELAVLGVRQALALWGLRSDCALGHREGALRALLGSPSSSTSPKVACSHLPHLALGSALSDSTAVHPTLPEQMCLKAQFSLF